MTALWIAEAAAWGLVGTLLGLAARPLLNRPTRRNR
jgi:hypothetical protein